MELLNAGICSKDLASFDYLRRHDNVFTSVATGRYDAGSLKESTFHKRNNKNGDLRVLHSFHNVTKPWLTRAGFDEDIFKILRSVMLELENQKEFKTLKIRGFFPTSHKEYMMVEEAMSRVSEFDNCGSAMTR